MTPRKSGRRARVDIGPATQVEARLLNAIANATTRPTRHVKTPAVPRVFPVFFNLKGKQK
ncbi:hypothetical protein [Actinobaculum massiliense]|uniref:hypothetical protein n=1 Tax=Actinobaculum massiliense TaxID=202789 RepID=UPI00071AF556|nr:hypothetical protein [Actinobaculum massiliense]